MSSRAEGAYFGDYTTGEGSPCGSRFPFRLWQGGASCNNYPCEKPELVDGSKEEIPQALFSSPRSVRDFGMTVIGGYSRGIFGVKSAREKFWKVANFSKKVVFGIKKTGQIWFYNLIFAKNFAIFLKFSRFFANFSENFAIFLQNSRFCRFSGNVNFGLCVFLFFERIFPQKNRRFYLVKALVLSLKKPLPKPKNYFTFPLQNPLFSGTKKPVLFTLISYKFKTFLGDLCFDPTEL